MYAIEPWLNELIQETGTPHFVFDIHIVRQQIHLLKHLFPSVTLFYSTKTNSVPAVIGCCMQEGMHFDAATIGEIELVLRGGARPGTILYTHPIKTTSEIQAALKLKVKQFTCDSLEELIKLEANAPGCDYFIRLNPPKSASLYNYQNRFGAEINEASEMLEYAMEHHLKISGLSFHVGTQSTNVKPWVQALGKTRKLVEQYHKLLPSLRKVNFGSGFPVDYDSSHAPDISQIAERINRELQKFPADISFMAEPGRILVAPSAVLAVSVVEKLKRGKDNWLFTDATVYSGLIERLESGGTLKYPAFSLKTTGPFQKYKIGGKTLDPDDILTTGADLSVNMTAGDLLFLGKTGAYTLEFFTKYHSLPRPFVTFYDSEHAGKVKITQSSISHKGVFTKRDINKDETIFTVTGHRSKKRSRTSFQISNKLHVEPTLFGAYLNHSCSPNAGISTNGNGLLNVVARKPIKAGKEITVDYAMFEYELADMADITCHCQTAECRKNILGYADLSDHKKEEYYPHTATHLL